MVNLKKRLTMNKFYLFSVLLFLMYNCISRKGQLEKKCDVICSSDTVSFFTPSLDVVFRSENMRRTFSSHLQSEWQIGNEYAFDSLPLILNVVRWQDYRKQYLSGLDSIGRKILVVRLIEKSAFQDTSVSKNFCNRLLYSYDDPRYITFLVDVEAQKLVKQW